MGTSKTGARGLASSRLIGITSLVTNYSGNTT